MSADEAPARLDNLPAPTQALGLLLRDPFLWLALLAGFLLRVGYNLALHGGGSLDTGSFIIDEREYFGAAHMLAEGRGFAFFDSSLWVRPPLFVALLAATLRGFGSSGVPILLIQSALSATSLLPLAWAAHLQAGRTAVRWTVILGALYLSFTLFAGLLLSETLFIFLFAWSLPLLYLARLGSDADGPRRQVTCVVSAAVLVGLCVLTRATALGYIPVAALWLAFTLGGSRSKRVVPVAGFVAVCLLVVMPWAARNYLHYGRFIGVDTTGGYNLWLGSVGVRDEERLQSDLRQIADPAARQDFAYARAWENIRSDPAGFALKGLKESLDLWRPLFSAEERQVRGYTSGRVPAWHLASLFVLDDMLYLAVLLLSIAGLATAGRVPLRSLTLLWVGLWVLTSFVFFAVTRFRLPVVAALLPWAGTALSLLGRDSLLSLARRAFVPRNAGWLALAGAVLLVVTPGMTVGDTLVGMQRWSDQEPYRLGEVLLSGGKPEQAVEAYRSANQDVPDTRYSTAAAYLQLGKVGEALAQLKPNEPDKRFEPLIIRGEAARMGGDLGGARSLFNARVVSLAGDEALVWAWDHIRPAPAKDIEIGSGLDVGYIRGFYGPETAGGQTFRWTAGKTMIRGLTGASAQITWSGWRPTGLPGARAEQQSLAPGDIRSRILLPNEQSWRKDQLTPVGAAGSLVLGFNPFIGSGSDPRLLGVRMARVSGR
ncbi:MAG TPA: hypothetical protein VM409_05540 [Chloroflexia bacterium]|nr:hypothetical protein [Chloroflexia bacterium]